MTQEHEKRVVLETIVSLLPREKNAIPVSFLSMVLRAATCLETTVACRLDLEKRIGLQLVEAVLDDLLIPSFSLVGNTMLDVDAVQRIMMNFLESEIENYVSPSQSEMEKVVKLMESYLDYIASDGNLSVSKFVNLAEIIPERAKLNEDGMYRAIDIYLKVHYLLRILLFAFRYMITYIRSKHIYRPNRVFAFNFICYPLYELSNATFNLYY